MVWIEYSTADAAGSSPCGMRQWFDQMDQGSKAEDSSFHLMRWLSQILFYIGNNNGIYLNLICCENVYFLSSANLDHGGGSGIPTAV